MSDLNLQPLTPVTPFEWPYEETGVGDPMDKHIDENRERTIREFAHRDKNWEERKRNLERLNAKFDPSLNKFKTIQLKGQHAKKGFIEDKKLVEARPVAVQGLPHIYKTKLAADVSEEFEVKRATEFQLRLQKAMRQKLKENGRIRVR